MILIETATAAEIPYQFIGPASPISTEVLPLVNCCDIDEQSFLEAITSQNRYGEVKPIFPITTVLNSGEFTLIEDDALIQGSLFVVGTDQTSRRWLQNTRDTLKQLNAHGVIVQAESAQAIQALQQIAGDLTMSLGNGDALQAVFGVHSYPTLITSEQLE